MLINSLLSAASDGDEFNDFMSDLDKLNVRKDVQVSRHELLSSALSARHHADGDIFCPCHSGPHGSSTSPRS